MSDTIDDLRCRLERAERRLAMFENLFLCKRCGIIGHDIDACISASSSVHSASDNDVFMQSRIDLRFIHHLPTEIWQLTMSYLPVHDLIPSVPLTCKYFNDHVVWGKYSGRLMWLEMARGPDGIDIMSRSDETLLMLVCGMDDSADPIVHVKSLIAGGANVNAKTRHGATALYRASRYRHAQSVRALLESKADPNITYFGSSILMETCGDDNLEVMSLLISNGANVNHTSCSNNTALTYMCEEGSIDCVRMLLHARADCKVRDQDGRTALDIARERDHYDIVHLLQEVAFD